MNEAARRTIGITSELKDFASGSGSGPIVRAKFRLGPCATGEGDLPDWVDVGIQARVFDRTEVERRNSLPEARAEGPEARSTARADWAVIDLQLPLVPYDSYVVQAKVHSRDLRFPRFEPSNCYAGVVRYGFSPVRMELDLLRDVYQGVGNPLAEAEIRKLVRAGLVVVSDESGRQLLRAREDASGLLLTTPIT